MPTCLLYNIKFKKCNEVKLNNMSNSIFQGCKLEKYNYNISENDYLRVQKIFEV